MAEKNQAPSSTANVGKNSSRISKFLKRKNKEPKEEHKNSVNDQLIECIEGVVKDKEWKDIFEFFQNGGDLNTVDSMGNTALHFFCEKRCGSSVSFLIELGANIIENHREEKPGDTFPSIMKSSEKLIKKLLSEYEERTAKGVSALDWALEGHWEDDQWRIRVLRALLLGMRSSDIEPRHLTTACELGDLFFVQEAVKLHDAVNKPIYPKMKGDFTMLDIVLRCNHGKIAEYLVEVEETPISISEKNAFQAARQDLPKIVKAWLERGTCDDGSPATLKCVRNKATLLHEAVSACSTFCISFLLAPNEGKHGFGPNGKVEIVADSVVPQHQCNGGDLTENHQEERNKNTGMEMNEEWIDGIKFLLEAKDHSDMKAVDWAILVDRRDIIDKILHSKYAPKLDEKTMMLAIRKGCLPVIKAFFPKSGEGNPVTMERESREKIIEHLIQTACDKTMYHVLTFLLQETDEIPLDSHDPLHVWRRDQIFRYGLVQIISTMVQKQGATKEAGRSPPLKLAQSMVEMVSTYNTNISFEMVKLISHIQFMNSSRIPSYDEVSVYASSIDNASARILCVCFGSSQQGVDHIYDDKHLHGIIRKFLLYREKEGTVFDYIWFAPSCIPDHRIGFGPTHALNGITAVFMTSETLIIPEYYKETTKDRNFFCTAIKTMTSDHALSQAEITMSMVTGNSIFVAFHATQMPVTFERLEFGTSRFYQHIGKKVLKYCPAEYRKHLRKHWGGENFCEVEDIARLAINAIWENKGKTSKFLGMNVTEQEILETNPLPFAGFSGPSLRKLHQLIGDNVGHLSDKMVMINHLLCCFCYLLEKFKSTGGSKPDLSMAEKGSFLSIIFCRT